MTISEENLKAREAATKSNFKFVLTPIAYGQSRSFSAERATWYTNESKSTKGDFIVQQPITIIDGTLELTNSLNYTDYFSNLYSPSIKSKTYSNDLRLSYNQPLFTYNKQKMEINQLRLAFENATLSYSIQRLSL